MTRYGALIAWDVDTRSRSSFRGYRMPLPEWFGVAGRLRAMRLRRRGRKCIFCKREIES